MRGKVSFRKVLYAWFAGALSVELLSLMLHKMWFVAPLANPLLNSFVVLQTGIFALLGLAPLGDLCSFEERTIPNIFLSIALLGVFGLFGCAFGITILPNLSAPLFWAAKALAFAVYSVTAIASVLCVVM